MPLAAEKMREPNSPQRNQWGCRALLDDDERHRRAQRRRPTPARPPGAASVVAVRA